MTKDFSDLIALSYFLSPRTLQGSCVSVWVFSPTIIPHTSIFVTLCEKEHQRPPENELCDQPTR